MAFAYADKYGTVHMVNTKEVAETAASGAVVETSYPCNGGYPFKNGEHIFIYLKEGTAFIGGNDETKGKAFDVNSDAELAAVVNKLK